MTVGPTLRMKSLATRWLTDSVRLQSPTYTAPTRAQMATDQTAYTSGAVYAASVRGPSVSLEEGQTVTRNVRDLTVWVESAATASAGDRCVIVTSGDSTLVGEVGAVITVERDSLKAVRRMTVRLGNDA